MTTNDKPRAGNCLVIVCLILFLALLATIRVRITLDQPDQKRRVVAEAVNVPVKAEMAPVAVVASDGWHWTADRVWQYRAVTNGKEWRVKVKSGNYENVVNIYPCATKEEAEDICRRFVSSRNEDARRATEKWE